MFNLPVKLSVLSNQYQALSPQVFLDRPADECIRIYKMLLLQPLLNTLEFAYTDAALLLMLEHEFEVQIAHRKMIFNKPALDAESWLYANGYEQNPEIEILLDDTLEKLTEDLWKRAGLFASLHQPVDDRVRLRREMKTLLTLFHIRYTHDNPVRFRMLQRPDGLRQFLNIVVAEAMFKADGARVLFGRDSQYYRLWMDKQQEFLHYALNWDKTSLRWSA